MPSNTTQPHQAPVRAIYQSLAKRLIEIGIPQEKFQEGLMDFIKSKAKNYSFTHDVQNGDGKMTATPNFNREGNTIFLSSVLAKSDSGEARFPVGQQYPHVDKMNRVVNRRHDQPVSIMVPEYINAAGVQKRMWVTMMDEKIKLEDDTVVNKFGYSTKELPAERYGHKFTDAEKKAMEEGKSVRLQDCELAMKKGDELVKTGLYVPQEVWPNMLSKKDCIPGSDSNIPVTFGYKPEVDVRALMKQAEEALAAGHLPLNKHESLQQGGPQEESVQLTRGRQPVVEPAAAAGASPDNGGWRDVPEFQYNFKFSDEQRKDLFEGKPVIIQDFKYWDKKEEKYTGQVGDVRFQWQKVGDGFQLKARAAKPEEVQESKRMQEKRQQPPGRQVGTSTPVQVAQQSIPPAVAASSHQRQESEAPQKTRGRPPGSKNKPKAEGQAGKKTYSMAVVVGGYKQKVDSSEEPEKKQSMRIS